VGRAWPGKDGTSRSASCPARRASIAGRRSSIVIAKTQGWRDLEVGGVGLLAADDALGDPVIDPLQDAGKRRQVAAHVLVGRLVDARVGDDYRQGAAGAEPGRNAELGPLEVTGVRSVCL
jgi:hypothetical protein